MPTNFEFASLFKRFDAAALAELLLILAAAALLIISTQRLLPWVAARLHGKERLQLLALVPLVRLLIILAAFVLIVPLVIEPSLQNMVALLGAVGLALGFAVKDYASSLIAGIVVIGEKPYRNGDWIEVNGIYGEVRHVGMRAVQLVTPDDTLASIPHARLWNAPILNANNGHPRLQCVADFFLQPQHDAARVLQVLEDVALTSAYLHFDEPIAVVAQEKPWGTHYRVRAYPLDAHQQFRFITDLTVRGKAALSELGVRFAVMSALPVSPDAQTGPT